MQSHDIASDCIQNLFLNLWKSRKNLAAVTAIKPYLFKALRRDLGRHARFLVIHNHSGSNVLDVQAAPVFSPEDLMVADETRKHLHAQLSDALNKLPARQREAVYLKYYEELSYQEVSAVMGINYQSVVNLLFKALSALKKEAPVQRLTALLQVIAGAVGISYQIYFL